MASPFSGKAGRDASVAAAKLLNEGHDIVDDRIYRGKVNALNALKSGYTSAKSWYDDARDLYQPYADTGLTAFNSYADASGVNGQAGYDRAEGNFRASPGYQWQVDQATDAVARKASSLGALGSGNTMTAITDRASSLADLEYDDYLGRLDNVAKTGFAATGAQAGITKGIGDLGMTYGAGKADIHQNSTGMSVNNQWNTTQALTDNLVKGMMAGQNAAANRWNAGMQGLKLVADFAGSSTGSKLFGL